MNSQNSLDLKNSGLERERGKVQNGKSLRWTAWGDKQIHTHCHGRRENGGKRNGGKVRKIRIHTQSTRKVSSGVRTRDRRRKFFESFDRV